MCQAKDALIAAQQEQIEWLRLQLGTPLLDRQRHEREERSAAFELTSSPWVGDEESDIEYMRAQGLLNEAAAAAALEQIGAMNTEIEFG